MHRILQQQYNNYINQSQCYPIKFGSDPSMIGQLDGVVNYSRVREFRVGMNNRMRFCWLIGNKSCVDGFPCVDCH